MQQDDNKEDKAPGNNKEDEEEDNLALEEIELEQQQLALQRQELELKQRKLAVLRKRKGGGTAACRASVVRSVFACSGAVSDDGCCETKPVCATSLPARPALPVLSLHPGAAHSHSGVNARRECDSRPGANHRRSAHGARQKPARAGPQRQLGLVSLAAARATRGRRHVRSYAACCAEL